MKNPLLSSFVLPPFSDIKPQHIFPAVEKALYNYKNVIETIVNLQTLINWDTLCQPLLEIDNYFSRIWSTVSHLNMVSNTLQFRESYEKSILIVSEFFTWIGQNKTLYNLYKKIQQNNCYQQFSIAQKKSIENIIRDFELSGILLSSEKKFRYKKISSRLSELSFLYNNNILDSTNAWSKLVTNKQDLTGVPKNILKMYQDNAKNKKFDGWLITLDMPSYLPILMYCDNSQLRQEVYYAYNTRASDQGPHSNVWDNSSIMNEILSLRHELSKILGFKNYVEQSLSTKMACFPSEVLKFLTNLIERSKPYGKKEFLELENFSKKNYSLNFLNPWDLSYYREKQKQKLFFINDEHLRSYFPENRVIEGLFKIVKRVFKITVRERYDVNTWNSNVRFFDLFNSFGEIYGSFYLDLYARENKQSGAWMDDCINMMRYADGYIQKPVAYIICNFTRPYNGHPSLFTHNEVITLFHEFGHGLHHMLTCIDIPGVSGINGVPWDAVELPSQLMENFCWKQESLNLISGHYETNDPLPDYLLEKLIGSKYHHSALFILRQLELSLFDFRIHYEYSQKSPINILKILTEVQKQVSVVPRVKWNRFPHTFSHIFSGGYSAGYYSYLWANVLASDAWFRFEEEGIFNCETGKSFIQNILSQGGSEDPIILFTRFRGRKPCLDFMLRNYGINKKITL